MAFDNSMANPTTGTTISTSGWGNKVVQNIQWLARKNIAIELFGTATDVSTGDGKKIWPVPPELSGWKLVAIHGGVYTAGITGTTDYQINNITTGFDLLTTKLTIDSGETGSETAATPAVIDTSHDILTAYDRIRFDVDAKSTTPPKGTVITLTVAPA